MGNHSTEAMEETGLFAIVQVMFVRRFMPVHSTLFLSNTLNLFVSVLGHDEGPNGPVP